VKVRLLLRQLPKPPFLRGFLFCRVACIPVGPVVSRPISGGYVVGK
jgi:hypothetical protein